MTVRVFVQQIDSTAFEQDVTVTEVKERKVKLQPGDEVEMLVRGQIGTVIDGEPGEVVVEKTAVVKILSVKRRKRG